MKSLSLPSGLFAFLSLAAVAPALAWEAFQPAYDRLVPRPPWEVDITDQLRSPTGQTVEQVFSPESEAGRIRGGLLEWSATILPSSLPEAEKTVVVLEADEARVLEQVSVNGKPLGPMNLEGRGELLSSGEGWLILPQTQAPEPMELRFISKDLPQVYQNGFGRLRLRPAAVDEMVEVTRVGNERVQLKNRSGKALKGALKWLAEDYFGVPLGEGSSEFDLPSGEKTEIPVPLPAHRELYKVRYQLEINGNTGLEYWQVMKRAQTLRARPFTLRLNGGWEYVFTNDMESSSPPSEGWKPVNTVPFYPPDAEYRSHRMWVRRTVEIPADWDASMRLRLFVPTNIHYFGRIFWDGRQIGEAANWELPARFEIPGSFKPGSSHTLLIAITDYVVGLAAGVKAPDSGPMEAPGRGVAAPMGTTHALRISFDTIPELEALPQVAVDRVVITTKVEPEKRLEAKVFVRAPGWKGGVNAKLFEAGREVLDLGNQALAGVAATFASSWPEAPLWSPSSPRLLELRVELLDPKGAVVDTFRERFGFREFGLKDGRFALNGHPLQLLGGSHIYVTEMLWPVRSHPYNFVRHGYTGSTIVGGGTASGIAAMNAADETGYLLKSADWNVNAHAADTYAWERPEIWKRLRSTWQQATTTYANHPSVVMWDVANEVTFRRQGEDALMGDLFQAIRTMDPTRLVTIGGSFPSVANAEVLNAHGWGAWNNRTDYWFARPEKRPSYLRDTGYYARKPAGDPATSWQLDKKDLGTSPQLLPGGSRELRHAGGTPVLFAEGHYYESSFPFALLGHDACLPQHPHRGWARFHGMNILATRTRSITNVRQAGVAGSMIHVDRGIGRAILPLAVYNKERRTRFRVGEPIRPTLEVHFNLPEPRMVQVRVRLLEGPKLLAEAAEEFNAIPFSTTDLALDFPAVELPGQLRLEVRAWPEGGDGWFSDDLLFRVFPQERFKLPKGQTLEVFDPGARITAHLTRWEIPFHSLGSLSDWVPSAQSTLLIGPEALAQLTPNDLASLVPKIQAGGRMIVLSQSSLPQFLSAKLSQSREFNSHVARMDFTSPILRGLNTEDLRAWQTHEGDQLVSLHPLDTPANGNFRVHATTVKSAPILEVAEGSGRVLFVQMNLDGALGKDPAADRLFANLLHWTGEPSPFARGTALVVGSRSEFIRPLTARLGLQGETTAAPSREQVRATRLVLLDGSDPSLRPAVDRVAKELRQTLAAGATLYVSGLDSEGARWLSQLLGTEVQVQPYPHQFARLTQWNSPVTAGLGHADFLLVSPGDKFNDGEPARGEGPFTGLSKIEGSSVRLLVEPAYLAELPMGKGRVVFDQTQGLTTPLPQLSRITSVVLSNLGATLEPGGKGKGEKENWEFQPVDLAPFVNRSLVDSDAEGVARGWNASGANNDLREFPTGRQNLRGVDYFVVPPKQASGNSMIALSGASPKLEGLPDRVEGIPVNAKADRLYFLHVSVWGVPGFTYRVYYKEDREKWIPGQPDPFVDVRVKPREHILDWVDARGVDRGETFMPGATVAWLGGTKRTRETSSTGGSDVGVFQMAWDNPHPEKTIESIDILSPGEEGSGHPFVLGITAARREGNAAPPPAPLAKVLPPGLREDQVAYHGRTDSFGYLLLHDGTLASLYDNEGKQFASSRGWVLEAKREGGGRSTLASQFAQKTEITTQREAGSIQHVIRGKTAALEFTIRLVASGGGLQYELTYIPHQLPENDEDVRLITGLQLTNGANTKGVKVNEMPVPVHTRGGTAQFNFDRRYLTWVFSYFVSAHEIGLVSPPKNAPPMLAGQKETLWWELSLP